MNLKFTLVAVFGIFLICSCKDTLEISTTIDSIENNYTITFEDALSSLENFMLENDMAINTKGGLKDIVDNYFTVSVPTTKSVEQDVLYAVNFKDDGGYALLSADSRISDDILAITDSGSILESDFYEPEISRTVSENDDLTESEFDKMVESGVLATELNAVNYECKSYALRQIEASIYDVSDLSESNNGATDSVSDSTNSDDSLQETFSWKTVKSVPRLISTLWTQDTKEHDIFNKYCPEVGIIWKNKAPAGCVCIAIAQIIACNEYPTNLKCDDIYIDYSQIKEIYSYSNLYGTGTAVSKEMLARFCKSIGTGCNTKYHSIFNKAWGFAWPSDARKCLELFGYQNAKLVWKYEEDKVLKSLDSGCPVFISAIAKVYSGHAWVIDGYIIRDYVSNKGTIANSQTMVHCNWGWQGLCNGYFTSGIFHTGEAAISDGLGSSGNEKYWIGFNTIIYDKPQK